MTNDRICYILTIQNILVKRGGIIPKSYSDQERAYITKRLKEEAADCLGQYGIKKTTVDELVKRVKIPKGTFYLFYPSKEMLFFEVLMEFHDSMQKSVIDKVQSFQGNVTCDELTELFYGLFKMSEGASLMKLFTGGEVEMLFLKLPESIVMEHIQKDDFEISNLISIIPAIQNKDIESFSAAFRALFLTSLNRREIGEECYDAALHLMIRGLVLQMLES